ncbi:MAG: oxidoreductase [Cyclobacteriaceae bacterium]|nr:oxidoreductase [Cyclobacteriaceae bacterium]
MSVALIAGASGLVGSKLLSLLLENEEYKKVISIGRRKLELTHSKLEQYSVDFEHLGALDIEANVVFCCLGTTIKNAGSKEAFRKVDFDYPKMLANYGLKIGASSFHIITAMGADSNSNIFYNKVKGEIENKLKELAFEQLHIYRPSLLLGKRQETRVMEGVGQAVMKALSFLFIGSLSNYKAISANQVAKFLLGKSLLDDNGTFIYLSGEMQL